MDIGKVGFTLLYESVFMSIQWNGLLDIKLKDFFLVPRLT